MDHVRFLPLVFICFVLTIQSSARYTASFSSRVIARDRHRLKDFTFKSFHSVSLVWCGLSCQRHPRCVSTNFRKVYNVDDLKGVCELNERAALSPIGETEALEYKEEMIYTQFEDVKVSLSCTANNLFVSLTFRTNGFSFSDSFFVFVFAFKRTETLWTKSSSDSNGAVKT